jgi:hypothetical protein
MTSFDVGRLCYMYELNARQVLRVERLARSWWMWTTRGQAKYAEACADLDEIRKAIAQEKRRHGL